MTPEGSISIEPPAWCASQFYLKANDTTTTNATGTRRTLLSTDIESSDHPLHNGLLTGFSVSPEALEARHGRKLNSVNSVSGSMGAFQPAVFTSSFNSYVDKARQAFVSQSLDQDSRAGKVVVGAKEAAMAAAKAQVKYGPNYMGLFLQGLYRNIPINGA